MGLFTDFLSESWRMEIWRAELENSFTVAMVDSVRTAVIGEAFVVLPALKGFPERVSSGVCH